MKIKGLLLVAISVLFVASSTTLYGCGQSHRHVFGYNCNSESHWLECDCGEIKEKSEAQHRFADGVCRTCSTEEMVAGLEFSRVKKGGETGYHVKSYKGSEKNVEIPLQVCGKPVTGVAYKAFSGCSQVEKIILPDTALFFGDYAFENCTSLKYFEENGFLYIGSTVNPYHYLAKSTNDTITSVTIKDGVKFVGTDAFYYHKLLREANIPKSVVGFAKGAFEGCKEMPLKDVEFKANYLGTADDWAQIYFSEPSSNPIFYSKKLYLNGKLIKDLVLTTPEISQYSFFDCDFETLTLAEGVEVIGKSAFQACNYYISKPNYVYYFTSLTLPSTLTTIEHSAFRNCSNLKNITMPKSVVKIGTHAFANCHDLGLFYYEGTTKDWKAIALGYGWTFGAERLSQVRCDDGIVAIARGAE